MIERKDGFSRKCVAFIGLEVRDYLGISKIPAIDSTNMLAR